MQFKGTKDWHIHRSNLYNNCFFVNSKKKFVGEIEQQANLQLIRHSVDLLELLQEARMFVTYEPTVKRIDNLIEKILKIKTDENV